jgi:hypothetical protein
VTIGDNCLPGYDISAAETVVVWFRNKKTELIMKTLLFVLFIAAVIQQPAAAKPHTPAEKRMLQAYAQNLNEENTGVVVSSMIHMMAYVKKHPETRVESWFAGLAKLMRDPSPAIQERAYLTLSALADRRILLEIKQVDDEHAEAVFVFIAKKIEHRKTVAAL